MTRLFPYAYYMTPARNFLNLTKGRDRLQTIWWQAYFSLEYMGVNIGQGTSWLDVLFMLLDLLRENAAIVP